MPKFAKKNGITEIDPNATADVASAPVADVASAPVADVASASMKVRISPVLTGVSNAVPIPIVKSNRGSKGAYPFDKLEIGQSFGVGNRNAKQMASIVSNANKRFLVNKTDESGNVVFKTTKASDGNGGFVVVPTSEPEKIASRRFIVLNVDPATDPDNASVRIWREA